MPVLFFLLAACDNHSEPEAHAEHAHAEPVAHAGHEAPSEPQSHAGHEAPSAPTLALTLNDGARWQMDPHTRETMGLTRATLAEAAVTDAASGQALGATLQGQLDTLISGCTMTGADHDALHDFLMVYMPAVQGLQSAADDEAAKAQLAALREMVAEYDRFFE